MMNEQHINRPPNFKPIWINITPLFRWIWRIADGNGFRLRQIRRVKEEEQRYMDSHGQVHGGRRNNDPGLCEKSRTTTEIYK